MVDNSMNDEKWQGKKDTLAEWYEANPEYADRKPLTDGLFGLGDNDTTTRKVHWQSIVNVFRGVVNSPIVRGRQSLMEAQDKKYLSDYLSTLYDAYYAFYESVAAIARPHGKSGLGLYSEMDGDSADFYATDQIAKAKTFLSKAFNAGVNEDSDERFWMTFDSDGQPVITDNGASSGGEEE